MIEVWRKQPIKVVERKTKGHPYQSMVVRRPRSLLGPEPQLSGALVLASTLLKGNPNSLKSSGEQMYVGDPNDLSPRDIYISNTTKERTYKFGFRYVLALDLSHATTPEVTPYNSHPNGTPAFTILDLV